ncbi:50S ribosomal protein L9 [Listeria cornellensis FSL F6-0969]|uniref:50S ribosomal protein L9 n=1 Tax=Listeria cornellensis FSL F6-0969 TaxID=1265820 RepID=W7BGY5_9LIST|nr:50S ribosomal protein L9 [Listeria cornellensis FSL F6-0969]
MRKTSLLKKGLATEATNTSISALEGQKKKTEKEAAQELADAKALKETVEKLTIELKNKIRRRRPTFRINHVETNRTSLRERP